MTKYTPVKILIVALMIAFAIYTYDESGVSTKSFDEVSEVMIAAIDQVNLDAVGQAEDTASPTQLVRTDAESGLKKYYGLSASDYEGVLYYMANDNMSADEILIIKLSDESQEDEVLEAINDRIDARTEVFRGYMPDEAALLDDSIVVTKSGFVFFAVSDKAEELLSTFEKAL